MQSKLIVASHALPDHVQDEMRAMQAALIKRYGPVAHTLGAVMENLATVCAMVGDTGISPEQRKAAVVQSQNVCVDVLTLLFHITRADRGAVTAVANAYRELAQRVEEELLPEVLEATTGDAQAAIAKAKAH